MSKFLHDDDDHNGDTKAIAIPRVFSENSQTTNRLLTSSSPSFPNFSVARSQSGKSLTFDLVYKENICIHTELSHV